MGITKKETMKLIKKIFSFEYLFLFLFLCLLPFGQLARFNIHLGNITAPLLIADVAVGLGALYTIFFQKKTKVLKYLSFFLAAATFSFILSYFYFGEKIVYGLFYLVRISSYFVFFNYIWNYIGGREKRKKLLIYSLISVSVISAIFGWVQMAILPDLKILFYIGWDMHLYRLAGAFFDPTFLGIIIVFGILTSINQFIEVKKRLYIPIIIFLLVSLAFTYARACFLALLAGLVVLGFLKRKFKILLGVFIGLVALILILPTSGNLSNKLTRTFSIDARFQNYKEAMIIIKEYPVFGVGYNNFCVARNLYIGEEPFSSHACSGSDSSLLLLLATTGIVGLMVFVGMIYQIGKVKLDNKIILLILPSMAAILVHSLFSNSLFYPWVMGYFFILLAMGVKE